MADTMRTTIDLEAASRDLSDARFEARRVIAAELRRVVPHIDVGDIDPFLPLRDEADLGPGERAALLGGIARRTGLALPDDALAEDTTLDELAQTVTMRTMLDRWHIDVTFSSVGRFDTEATAHLSAGLDHLDGCGMSRKNPSDPNVVDVGHLVAAARALAELSARLLAIASTLISEWDDDAEPLRR